MPRGENASPGRQGWQRTVKPAAPEFDLGPTRDWPAHDREIVGWRSQGGGTRDDRTLTEVEVWLPPKIADLPTSVPGPLAAQMEEALRAVSALDTAHADNLGSLGTLLIRTESVASSKIEQIEASIDDYARAMHGIKSNKSAVSMVAATDALAAMIGTVGRDRQITLPAILQAHQKLMAEDELLADRQFAGKVRDMQNWIGGSDFSPRNALYVPPPPDTVEEYLDDLVVFMNRDDLPVLTQAAIAHAQFESIHPFTDGNGRIGRVLINSVLRRRGVTTQVVVPIASAIVAHRDRYFDLLGDYREGHTTGLQESFTSAAHISAVESSKTATRLAEIPEEWRQTLGRVRSGSATHRLLSLLPENPVISTEDAVDTVGGLASGVYESIERLHQAGVLRPLTDRKKNQVWGAGAILDELDDLGKRIAAAAR